MALQLLDPTGAVLKTVSSGGNMRLPNGDIVSPALDGWSNADGYNIRTAPPPPPAPVEEPAETIDPNAIVADEDVWEVLDNL